jgi:hypothetical protein
MFAWSRNPKTRGYRRNQSNGNWIQIQLVVQKTARNSILHLTGFPGENYRQEMFGFSAAEASMIVAGGVFSAVSV